MARALLPSAVLLGVLCIAESFHVPTLTTPFAAAKIGVHRASSRKGASAIRCSSGRDDSGEQLLRGLPTVGRRGVLGGAVLGGLNIAVPVEAAHAELTEKSSVKYKLGPAETRNVVITGCNSGIGRDAAAKLAAGGYNVILACRTQEKAEQTKQGIEEEVGKLNTGRPMPILTPMECDLSSLASVREFAAKLIDMKIPIDILVLNAGLSLSTGAKPPPPRTKEGFELTVGTNHLGHFLLCNLLLNELAKNQRGARIVVTASQVHDPESPGGNVGSKATLGTMAGLERGGEWDMVDGGPFDGDKSYKDSKLCNVLFTRELSTRLKNSNAFKGVTVNCFSPGLITKSGLFRNQGSVFVPVFDFAVNNIFKVGETVEFGGDCLLEMACSKRLAGVSGDFWANSQPGKHTFEKFAVSAEAQDAVKAAKLWRLSVKATKLTSAESPFVV